MRFHEDIIRRLLLRGSQEHPDRPYVDTYRQIVNRWVQIAVREAKEAGELPTTKAVSPHTFRHSAARHWLMQGVPINRVSLWLGDSSISTTLVYLKLVPDDLGLMDGIA